MDKKKEMAIDFLETIKGQINHNDVLNAFTQGYDEGFSNGHNINDARVITFLESRIREIDFTRTYLTPERLNKSKKLESINSSLLDEVTQIQDIVTRLKSSKSLVLQNDTYDEIRKLEQQENK